MLFPTEGELRQWFDVEGAFYELDINGVRELCRSSLVIRRSGTDQKQTDALFVLTNPGKCMPVDQEMIFPKNPKAIEDLLHTAANPDSTQFQLMRLMKRMHWGCVRVINLSDLRSAKLEEFTEKLEFMNEQNEYRHSIFSEERSEELIRLVGSADRVIAAWGINPAILRPASKALDVLTSICTVEGLRHKNAPYYYHPFPRLHDKCIQWLDDMEAQLQGDMEPV